MELHRLDGSQPAPNRVDVAVSWPEGVLGRAETLFRPIGVAESYGNLPRAHNTTTLEVTRLTSTRTATMSGRQKRTMSGCQLTWMVFVEAIAVVAAIVAITGTFWLGARVWNILSTCLLSRLFFRLPR